MATPADTPTPSAAPEPSRKRKAWLLGLVLLLILAGVGAWAWYSLVGRWHESTDDAYVNGNVVEITPLVTGTVTSIGADDGDRFHAGQVLLQFDPADSQVALQAAEARLARSVRQVRGLYSNVDALKAQLETRQAELRKARQDFNRRKVLADSGAIAAEELSHARDDLSVAEAAVNSAPSGRACHASTPATQPGCRPWLHRAAPGPERRPRSRRVRGLGHERLANPDPPDLGTLLEVVPAELARVLGGELVVERLRVVVVDQHERGPRIQRAERVEDQGMAANRRLAADVEDAVIGHGLLLWNLGPLQADEVMHDAVDSLRLAGRLVPQLGVRRRGELVGRHGIAEVADAPEGLNENRHERIATRFCHEGL